MLRMTVLVPLAAVLLAACGRREAAAPPLPGHCVRERMYTPGRPDEVQELVTAALLQGGDLRTLDHKTVASKLGICVFALNFEIVRARDEDPTPERRRRFVTGSPAALFMRRALLSGRDDAFAGAQMDCYVYLVAQMAADRRSCQAVLDPKASPEELDDDAMVNAARALAPLKARIPAVPATWRPSTETGAADAAAAEAAATELRHDARQP